MFSAPAATVLMVGPSRQVPQAMGDFNPVMSQSALENPTREVIQAQREPKK